MSDNQPTTTPDDEETPIVLEAVLITSQSRGLGDAALRRLRVLSAPRYVKTFIFDGSDELLGSEAADGLMSLIINGHSFELRQGAVERVGLLAYVEALDVSRRTGASDWHSLAPGCSS